MVDWGREMQGQAAERRGRRSVAARIGIALLFVWAVFLAYSVVRAVIEQRWGDLIRGLIFVGALVLPSLMYQRNLRRAVARNGDEPAEG